jgi:ketosteroid isomerase-like protein
MSNVDLVRALYQSINDEDPAAGAAHFAADAEWTEVPTGQTYRGPSGWHENYRFWKGAFPDGRVELTNVIDGGDRVAVEYTGSGTNTGPLPMPDGALPPTGKSVTGQFVDVWDVREGKIVGGRSYFDMAGLMAQLGVS